ncbi:Uncharacterised protein [Mycobacterium tuberculosis]|nr:Uncharacterised protein [Streptococcus pneumoniae]CIV92228.1 Uncharacterised protein [Streptococcus pneumoniae]CKU01405.1 Uncharacterised protein [Mycobacterium tuberculosis]CKW62449.1 Uncharacterised protein [Mycobacterium tuberculosis]
MVEKDLHYFLTLDDSFLINQGAMNPRTQETHPHSRFGFIQKPEKTALFLT